MSELSKQALKVENTESFPNNNAGEITPSDLRTFNENMIDSLVDEITYNEDSASWNQSIDALEQFTASQQPSFTALNEFTASQLVVNSEVNSFTQSADGRLDAIESELTILEQFTASVNQISDDGVEQGYATRFNFTGNVSASIVQNVGGPIASINVGSAETGSLLTTASFDEGTRNLTFTKGDSSQFSVYIADVSGSVLPSGVVSGSSQIILQDTTGDLSGSRIDGAVALATNSTYSQNTITTGKNIHSVEIPKGTPLFFTGSGTSGNLVGILPADAGNPARMPAGGVAGETIAVGAEGVVLLDGFINGVDTSLFASGQKVYVGVGGGYTNVEPTGSALIQFLGNIEKAAVNGSGVIQMMGEARRLPNLTSGYAWVGDSNGVPQAVSTGSWGGGGGTIDTGSFATTGSNSFNGNQIISGSVGISGSGLTNTGDIYQFGNYVQLAGDLNYQAGGNVNVAGNVLVSNGSVRITTNDDSKSFRIQNTSGASWNQTISTNTGSGVANAFTDYLGVDTVFFQTDGNFTINSKQGGASGSISLNGYNVGLTSDNTIQLNNSSKVTGDLEVTQILTSDIFSNPQTLTGTLTIPTDRNAMVVGTVAVDGDVVIQGDSKLVVIDQLEPYTLPEGILSSSATTFAEFTSSVATTGSNTFVGDQFISGNIELEFNGSTRTGVKYNSGSSQIFAGINADGNYIISSSGNDRTIEINPANGWMEVYGTANFNTSMNARAQMSVRDITTDIGFGYTAQFDGLQATNGTITNNLYVSQSVTIGQALSLLPTDPLPTGNVGDLAVSGSSLYFYNGAWTLIV